AFALQRNVAYLYTPNEVLSGAAGEAVSSGDARFRLGGMVETGSFRREDGSLVARFRVTDGDAQLEVVYDRMLPDLFREGQAVVATGRMREGVFVAEDVLAKHDETYVAKEVADKMGLAHARHHVEDAPPAEAGQCWPCTPARDRRPPSHRARPMLPELGQAALLLALVAALLQALLPLAGAAGGRASWMAVARPAAYAQLALLLFAYAVLTLAFVQQDFSVKYVADNSNSLLPMVYRFTAVWGAHEGSMLLWVLMLAVWNA